MLVVKGIGTKQFFQWTTSPTAHRSQSNCWLGMKSYRCGQQYHLPTQYLQLIHLLHRKIRHLIQLNLVNYFLLLLVLKPNKTPIYCVLSFSQPASPQVALASPLRKSRALKKKIRKIVNEAYSYFTFRNWQLCYTFRNP